MKTQKYFTFKEFMAYCEISRDMAYRLLRSGEIPRTKVGGKYQIPKDAVCSYKKKVDRLENFMTIRQFSKKYNLTRSRILSEIYKGILKAKKMYRNTYYISYDDADEYISKRMIGVCEFAKRVGMYRTTIYKNIIKGRLPAKKCGRSYLISVCEIEPFIKIQRTYRPVKRAKSEKRVITEINPEEKKLLRKYYEKKLQKQPDAMTFKNISKVTGYCISVISSMVKDADILVVNRAKGTIIPKEDVIELFISARYNSIYQKSNMHYEDLKNALSE
ncbi:MAG TPA: hypothetical protein DCO93_03240 [Clostridiales bacterium]|nr:hypothetical protein [Clostridiales bacterium]